MKPTLVLMACVALGVCGSCLAQCELFPNIHSSTKSQQVLAIRGAIFQELCKRSQGALVDAEDADLGERLSRPAKPIIPTFTTNEDAARRIKGTVVLAYIVETDGRVSWVSVIEPSGNKEVDSTAFRLQMATRFRAGGMLDGKPVRLFQTLIYRF